MCVYNFVTELYMYVSDDDTAVVVFTKGAVVVYYNYSHTLLDFKCTYSNHDSSSYLTISSYVGEESQM